MAPGARIDFVASDCTSITDPLDAETRIVDGHLANIVSDSWHLGLETQMPAGLIPAFEQVFEQGAVEGIGFYFSSGDRGDWTPATGGAPAVQYPGIDPWVTSVGGTSLAVSARGGYEWETGWGTDIAPLAADGTSWTTLPGAFYGGAGGGTSTLFAQPFYQRGVVPAALGRPAGAAQPMRVMPDIAADADPSTGMLIGLSQAPTPTSPPVYTSSRLARDHDGLILLRAEPKVNSGPSGSRPAGPRARRATPTDISPSVPTVSKATSSKPAPVNHALIRGVTSGGHRYRVQITVAPGWHIAGAASTVRWMSWSLTLPKTPQSSSTSAGSASAKLAAVPASASRTSTWPRPACSAACLAWPAMCASASIRTARTSPRRG
jgi:hypothetical protein